MKNNYLAWLVLILVENIFAKTDQIEVHPKYINKNNYEIELNNKKLIINLKFNSNLINSKNNNKCHFNGHILNHSKSYVALSICEYYNKIVSIL
jgi:hypothetical protein